MYTLTISIQSMHPLPVDLADRITDLGGAVDHRFPSWTPALDFLTTMGRARG